MNFLSDNTSGFSLEVMQAIQSANGGSMSSYGNDPITQKTREKFCEIFEKDVAVYFTATGTAANSLALKAITPTFGAILCHEDAHINVDEANAIEMHTGGAKLVSVSGDFGLINPDDLENKIKEYSILRPHRAKATTLSLTQATEWGAVYDPTQLENLIEIARKYDLKVHMDGSRFANALAFLTNKTPAELTWKVGVDVLCLGGTKNGALASEAVVFFNKDLARHVDYYQKQAGQLLSKMRFFSCQFGALFENDLWIKNAAHANKMASALSESLLKFPGVKLLAPVHANEVFVQMDPQIACYLRDNSVKFYDWGIEKNNQYRFVTSFDTQEDEIRKFQRIASALSLS